MNSKLATKVLIAINIIGTMLSILIGDYRLVAFGVVILIMLVGLYLYERKGD